MLPDPTRLPAADADEFATAFNLVMNAAAGRVELVHRLGEASNSEGAESPAAASPAEAGKKHWLLADKPLNRGLVALRERYRDPFQFNLLALRIAALTFAASWPELRPWARPNLADPGTRLLHPAVVDAAAVSPLTASYEFALAPFLANIARIAEAKYPGVR